MVGHGGSSAGSYLAYPTSPIPSHCASIVMTSTLRVNIWNIAPKSTIRTQQIIKSAGCLRFYISFQAFTSLHLFFMQCCPRNCEQVWNIAPVGRYCSPVVFQRLDHKQWIITWELLPREKRTIHNCAILHGDIRGYGCDLIIGRSFFTQTSVVTLGKKATIHQLTTMLSTSKNVRFPGHKHLLTTGTDDPSLASAQAID